MIYLVTSQQELFESSMYKIIGAQTALDFMKDWTLVQLDAETTGRDANLCSLLSVQFGNDTTDKRIVVDCSTIDIKLFKEVLENKRLIGHNLKFDLQFLYNYGIIPRKVYDTMIVEQMLYLGYPSGIKQYSLKAVAQERLGIDIDKSIRGEIIWRGLSPEVIQYAAGDVTFLEKIMHSQLKECKEKDCIKAAQLECDAVPAMAYLEWCGIKLDENKWKEKMLKDQENLNMRKAALDRFTTSNPSLEEFTYVERQGDLFAGFDLTPRCLVNWDSSQQVIKVVKKLGFDTTVQDKQTGEDKDSVLEKTLKMQKGINDTFLQLYFDYKESSKVCSTYGQGHLNAINPKTGRIHTTFKQIGASSGRMSCGSNQSNTDLAKEKGISASKCTYPNLQQLPADEPTRSSFVAEKGNMFVSCDWSAIESRLGGDIYQEQSIINEFLHGSGDMHSLVAKMVFPELKDIPVKDIKKKFPELRKAAKPIEFSQQFGGSEHAIQGAMGCTLEEALAFKNAYDKGFSGISKFKEQGSKFVQEHGYILICKYTGHKMYWWDWKQWKERQSSFTPEFWEEYRNIHKGTRDSVALMVKEHFKAASKYNRMALNSPTQGTGAICLKSALTTLFNWIVDNNLFNKVKICCAVHDELCVEFPETMPEFPKILEKIMEEAAAKYCKSLPIPAEASVDTHWVH